MSIFHFGVYQQADAFSSIFNLHKFLSSITALNYLRTVLTVIISQVAQVCLEKTKGTSVYITPWHLFVSSLAYLSPPWNRLNCKLYKQLESGDSYRFNKTPQTIVPEYIWKKYNSRVDISLDSNEYLLAFVTTMDSQTQHCGYLICIYFQRIRTLILRKYGDIWNLYFSFSKPQSQLYMKFNSL